MDGSGAVYLFVPVAMRARSPSATLRMTPTGFLNAESQGRDCRVAETRLKTRIIPGCGYLPEKIVVKNAFYPLRERVPFRETIEEVGVPPLPPPSLNALTGAGFAKMARKILSDKGLEVKILTTKDLHYFSRPLPVLPPP